MYNKVGALLLLFSLLLVKTMAYPVIEPQLLVSSIDIAQDTGIPSQQHEQQHPDPLENIGVELESGILIEGDVRYVMNRMLPFQQIVASGYAAGASESLRHPPRNSISSVDQIWTDKIVPYQLDPTLNETELHNIQSAIQQIMDASCVEFVSRSTERNFIYITQRKTGCWSETGMSGGNQTVSVSRGSNCVTPGVIMHELMHALGFWHEHNRRDRDHFITVLHDNIMFDHVSDFHINQNSNILISDYDYYSIMHYKTTTYSKDKQRLKTILIKANGVNESRVGQRDELSDLDKRRINLLYNCFKTRRNPDTELAPEANQPTTEVTESNVSNSVSTRRVSTSHTSMTSSMSVPSSWPSTSGAVSDTIHVTEEQRIIAL